MPPVRGGADKWKARTAAAARDYAAGVQRPRVPWSQAAMAARESWAAGVQDAIQRGAYEQGVTEAGDARWQQGVAQKGAARFAPGVQASGERYERGFAPYRQIIEQTSLPPRGRRGDPANLERVRALSEALNTARRQRRGGGT